MDQVMNARTTCKRGASPAPILIDASGAQYTATPPTPKIKTFTDRIKEREEAGVLNMVQLFRQIAILATAPVEDGATKEVAAAQAFELEVQSSALIRAAEELLQLTRELKELWLFGPLRGINEGEGEGKMDEDSAKVGKMIDALLKNTSG